jgi:hypothetical protein
MMGGTDAQLACDEGLLEEIDWDTLGRDGLLPEAVQECAVGNVVIGNGFAYNAAAVPEAPNDWADFFDLEKFPGKRGMTNNPTMNLEYALMADGVPPAEVYAVLSTPEASTAPLPSWTPSRPSCSVGGRVAAGGMAGGRQRRHEHRLQWPHHQRQEGRQAAGIRLEQPPLQHGRLGGAEGKPLQGPGDAVPQDRQ